MSKLLALAVLLPALLMTPQAAAASTVQGVRQHGPDCLAAASVTFLEAYGLHVSQFAFGRQDPEANPSHAAVIINGYLRPYHVHVVTAGAMTPVQLRSVLAYRHPVLATLWDGYLPEWHAYRSGAGDVHEVMLLKFNGNGYVRFWDPAFGWETVSVYAIAAATWEYIIPA